MRVLSLTYHIYERHGCDRTAAMDFVGAHFNLEVDASPATEMVAKVDTKAPGDV